MISRKFCGLLGLTLVACTTSMDVAQKGPSAPANTKKRGAPVDDDDPSGVKTVTDDGPAKSENEGVSNEALQRQVAILQGEIEDVRAHAKLNEEKLQARVKQLEEEKAQLTADMEKLRTQAPPPALAAEGGKGAAALWNLAVADLKAGKVEDALGNFQEIAKSYPKDERHAYALLGAGFSHYRLKQHKDAAVVFNQFIDKHAKHPAVSLAWFGGGASLSSLGQSEDAKLFYDEVVKRHPKSGEAKEAKAILAKKKKAPVDLFAAFPAWAKGAP